MSLTYGGTTYRSLEEQVRKNMKDISTEAESLAALTDKVDNLKTGGTKVSLTFPAGASSGKVTDEQLATLQANDENYIEMVNDKELYYLNDPGHKEGFLTYSHVGIENSKATIKTLTITVSAKSFVIVTTVVPNESGEKLYLHKTHIHGTNVTETSESITVVFCVITSISSEPFEYTTTSKIPLMRDNFITGYFTDNIIPQTYRIILNIAGDYSTDLSWMQLNYLNTNNHVDQLKFYGFDIRDSVVEL